MRTRHVIAVLVLAGAMPSPHAGAQGTSAYPTKPVRVIVPSPAGGNPDFIVRPVAQRMSESLKQPFIVDNRGGANGIVGLDATAKSPADGYTILLGAIGHFATNYAINEKLPFDTFRDFTPIVNLVETPFYLFVHPSLPVRSVKEYIALAKAQPGKITYMSFGVGSFPHFLSESLSAVGGVKLLHVPYKGSGPAQTALLAGHVVSGFDAMQSTLPHLKAGRLRVLAVASEKRARIAPELPTFAEVGLPHVGVPAWFGLFAPGATPRDVVVKLNAEAIKALGAPEIRHMFEPVGFEIVGSTPEDFAAKLRRDIDMFVKVARRANIRAE